MRIDLPFVAALAALCAAPATAGTNLVVNGSFELPRTAVFSLFDVGSSFPGWTVIGERGNVAVVNRGFIQNGIVFGAAGGMNWLDLTGGTNTPVGVQQTIDTEPGKPYRLTFRVGNVIDRLGPYGTTSVVKVRIDGKTVFTAKNTGAPPLKMGWKGFVVDFTAKGPRTTIAFINQDRPTDNSNGLDSIVVEDVSQ